MKAVNLGEGENIPKTSVPWHIYSTETQERHATV